jgi:hypothetical protein
MKKALALSALCLSVLAGLLASFSRHVIWERETSTQLIWSSNEAYFFVGRQREGWSGNLLQVGWEMGRAYFGLPANRTDRKRWLEVNRITDSQVTKTVISGSAAFPVGVFEGHIYVPLDGELKKWVDDNFVSVSPLEQFRFQTERQGSGEYRDVLGWSVEINIMRGLPFESSYPLILNGLPVVVEVSQQPERRTAVARFRDGKNVTLLDLHTKATEFDARSYRGSFAVN